METKEFDCVEMKRKSQALIYEKTKDMTPEEELAYWKAHEDRFRRELEELRHKNAKHSDRVGAKK
ncbi:hypothetical protein IIA79_06035 [bacterium]|nr:hypothetical protein [bacterium]